MPARKRARSAQESVLPKRNLVIALAAGVLLLFVAAALVFAARDDSPAQSAGQDIDKSKGDAKATVIVTEYADFQCPACRRFFTGTERQLKEQYVDKGLVRYVFRNMAFLGNESRWAAEASECANEQSRFWEYHDKLFEKQAGENVGVFSKGNLKLLAAGLGLQTAQFDGCLDSGKYAAKVQQELAEAQQKGVRGTPAVLVNGKLIEGGADYQVLRAAIDAALGRR